MRKKMSILAACLMAWVAMPQQTGAQALRGNNNQQTASYAIAVMRKSDESIPMAPCVTAVTSILVRSILTVRYVTATMPASAKHRE